MINWLVEEADDILQEDVYRTISQGFSSRITSAVTGNKSKIGLAEASQLATGSTVGEGNDGTTESMDHGSYKNNGIVSIESFLESATEEDVELLRR